MQHFYVDLKLIYYYNYKYTRVRSLIILETFSENQKYKLLIMLTLATVI